LRQHFEDFQTLGAGQRFAHTGNLLVQEVFESALVYDRYSKEL
jgi:hypothetical protein